MILSTPDTKGKGQGVIGELGGLLPIFYDFHYAIELENMNEEEISCKMDKYDAHFTVEINEKNYITGQKAIWKFFVEKKILKHIKVILKG